MDTIIICLIVTIIGYCLINQIEVNELCAELDKLKRKTNNYETKDAITALKAQHEVLKDKIKRLDSENKGDFDEEIHTACTIERIKVTVNALEKRLTRIDGQLEVDFDEIALIKSRLLDLELAKAVEDCPHNEILHYHHDGCPACHKIYKYDGRIFPTEELEAN